LSLLSKASSVCYGIEAVDANLANAESFGVPRKNLFHVNRLPEELPKKVDVWFFLDSFEHIPHPGTFLTWMSKNTAPNARVVLVAPEAGSISDRLLGKLWPHKLEDHVFHWSRKGICSFFDSYGFHFVRKFFPKKYVSTDMICDHINHKIKSTSFGKAKKIVPNVTIPFNIGEMGIMFEYEPACS
jgi:hypothetical protein